MKLTFCLMLLAALVLVGCEAGEKGPATPSTNPPASTNK